MPVRAALVTLIVCAAPAASASAAITLSQAFDSGSLNVPASVVSGSSVSLVGRRTWSAYPSNYRWVYFKAAGVQGLNPTFSISSSSFLGSYTAHRYVYSYDNRNWSFFDHGAVSGGNYVFSNAAPFAQDEVYVAYSLPYPVWRTAEHTAAARQSPFAHATASGGEDWVIGQSAGGVDDSGRLVPPQDLVTYRISDDGFAGAKKKIVLANGNHAGETPTNFAFEGMVNFLLSADPRAAAIRRSAEIFVYPQLNPDGRFGGYYRSNPENPSRDFNRYWNNPAGFTDMTQLRGAMLADTGGDIDLLLDFHSWFGPWTSGNFMNITSPLLSHPFTTALGVHEPEIDPEVSAGASGMLRIWAMSAAGLRADYAATPEIGAHTWATIDRLLEMGGNFGLALFDALPINDLPGDFDESGVVDVSDLGILATHWQQSVAGSAFGDANGDGVVDVSDLGVLATHWQSGTGAAPAPGAFVAAAASFGLSAFVPEPASLAFAAAVGGLLARRPRGA